MNNTKSGIGFWGVLLIVFIVLKVTDLVDWGWVWVLAPLWIPMIIAAPILIIIGICLFLKGR